MKRFQMEVTTEAGARVLAVLVEIDGAVRVWDGQRYSLNHALSREQVCAARRIARAAAA